MINELKASKRFCLTFSLITTLCKSFISSHNQIPAIKKKVTLQHCSFKLDPRFRCIVKDDYNYMNTVLVSRSASMHADKIVLLNIVPSTSAIRSSLIGPLQLVIHVVQNRHGGEQQTHRDKKNKELTSWFTINKSVPLFVCSQCFSCSPAWRALTTWIRGGSRASDKKISGGGGGGLKTNFFGSSGLSLV